MSALNDKYLLTYRVIFCQFNMIHFVVCHLQCIGDRNLLLAGGLLFQEQGNDVRVHFL